MKPKDFSTIRKAYRYVTAYQRRLLDGLAKVHESLDPRFSFHGWDSIYHNRPCGRGSQPFDGKWAWDFVPLYDSVFEWRLWTDEPNRAGNVFVFVEHVADSVFEEAYLAKRGEKDPLELGEESDSVLRGYWVKLYSQIRDELWRKQWNSLLPAQFGCKSMGDLIPLRPSVSQPPHKKDGVEIEGFCCSLIELMTPQDFKAKFVDELITRLKRPLEE